MPHFSFREDKKVIMSILQVVGQYEEKLQILLTLKFTNTSKQM
jgi:hypothetical protein